MKHMTDLMITSCRVVENPATYLARLEMEVRLSNGDRFRFLSSDFLSRELAQVAANQIKEEA